ncbi:MAG: SCO1664 family protein [Aggregatilineales bacterium]
MTKPTLYTARDIEDGLTVEYDLAVKALQEGDIREEHGLMRWGSNYTFLVTVCYEDTEFLAVYKPRMGERPLWDFPDGTLCQREAAAWVISEALGWSLVPPTILRDGTRGIGSMQVFINHDPQRHYFNFDEQHLDGLMQVAALDAIINNADRKGGHCLLDETDRIWCIDHGLSFHTMNKLRTVIWDFAGEDIPDTILSDIEKLCLALDNPDNQWHQALAPLLKASEYKMLCRRLTRLMDDKTYPLPGSGPNRPWPAV